MNLLKYYKEIINQTEVPSQLHKIQLAIGNKERLTAEQKVILFDLVNEKFQKNTQQEIIQHILKKINKETNIVKLQVYIKDKIANNKDLTSQQKYELHNVHNEKIRNLCENTEMIRNDNKNQLYDLILDLIKNKLLNTKLQELQQPPKHPQEKHPIKEVKSNNPTTSSNKADQKHNLAEINFKKTKIDKMKKLIALLNNYLYKEPRKKAMISKERLRKHNAFRKLRKHSMIFVKASELSFNNPFMFSEEKIDEIASIKVIID
ncbi:17035_t:CDS:2, partial [Cetraspora pellucida]